MAPPASAVAAAATAAQHVHAASRSPSPRKSNRRHQSTTATMMSGHQGHKNVSSSSMVASGNSSGTSTPGLIALSPAMAAQVGAGLSNNAATQGSPSSKTARKSRGYAASAQRKGVQSQHIHGNGIETPVSDSSDSRHTPQHQSRAEAILQSMQRKHSSPAAEMAMSLPKDEGLSLGDASVMPDCPALSSTRHKRATRKGRRHHESTQASHEQIDAATTTMNVDAVDPSLIATDVPDVSLVTPARHRRSKRITHGQPSPIPSTTMPAELLLEDAASVHQLSRSAPASSFLKSAFAVPVISNHTKQASDPPISASKKTKSSSNVPTLSSTIPIHSSNSADEWDMPLLGKRNDALTWQQVGLSRKSSLGPHTQSKAYKKQALSALTSNATPKAASPSGLSTLLAQKADLDAKSSALSDLDEPASAPLSQTSSMVPAPARREPNKANTALTWQQELFRATAPSTPTELLFSALEEGHTGANPAKDHRGGLHTRMSSSPVKSGRIATNNAVADSRRLNNSLAALSLAGSKGTPQRKRASTSDSRALDIVNGHSDGFSMTRTHNRPVTNATVAESVSGSSEDSNVEHSLENLQIKSNSAWPDPTSNSNSQQSIALSKATPPLGSRLSEILSKSPTKPVAMSNSPTLYAGPRFHNSPSPGQLPTPRLAAMMNRNKALATTAVSETTPAF